MSVENDGAASAKDVRSHQRDDRSRSVAGPGRIGFAVEIRGREILGALEREFAIATKFACDRRHAFGFSVKGGGQPLPLGEQHLRNVVNAGRID